MPSFACHYDKKSFLVNTPKANRHTCSTLSIALAEQQGSAILQIKNPRETPKQLYESDIKELGYNPGSAWVNKIVFLLRQCERLLQIPKYCG